MRNICAVHSPTPHTEESIRTISSSVMRDTLRRRTEPAAHLAARSFTARVFAAENPAPRKLSSESSRHSSTVGNLGPGVRAQTRP